MFNFFKKSAPADTGSSSPEQLAKVCAPRRWTFCPDRAAVLANPEVAQWIPAEVAFCLGDAGPGRVHVASVVEDRGCNFIFGNELGLKFCVCEVARPHGSGGPVNVYVARNWKKVPPLSVTALATDAKLPPQSGFADGSKLARSYVLEAPDPVVAAAVFTRQVEPLLARRRWHLLAQGDWFTCHIGGRVPADTLDSFVQESTQLLMALPQGK
jgi:hypothetical protein